MDKAWAGKSVIVIGVVHSAFGLVVLGDLLAPAIREGSSTPSQQRVRRSATWRSGISSSAS